MKAGSNQISFWMDDRRVDIDFAKDTQWRPTTTVLNYLRSLPNHKGTKEGCAEGDCGACTVALAETDENGKITYRAIDSCLVFLPMIHGKHLISVENLGNSEELHPVQKAMVDCDGSQCGYCTPGFIMSLFALSKSPEVPDREAILDALTGNLCRCTGYRPIVEAAAKSCTGNSQDRFWAKEAVVAEALNEVQIHQPSVAIATTENTYFRPGTLEEALEIRQERPDALLVCGGTDVGLMVTKKKLNLPLVLDLSGVSSLRGIEETTDGLKLGATLSLEKVKGICKTASLRCMTCSQSSVRAKYANRRPWAATSPTLRPSGTCHPS